MWHSTGMAYTKTVEGPKLCDQAIRKEERDVHARTAPSLAVASTLLAIHFSAPSPAVPHCTNSCHQPRSPSPS